MTLDGLPRQSGLFLVFGVACGSLWRCERDVDQRMNETLKLWAALKCALIKLYRILPKRDE